MNVVSIGEVLWDLVGQEEHLGGAAFNFSAHLAKLGHKVSFISAVGQDERGERILERMPRMGLSTRYVKRVADYPTGMVTVSLDAEGIPQYVIHRPAAYDFPLLTEDEVSELFSSPVDWIYFGTLMQVSPAARRLTMQLLDAARNVRRFYDINLRDACWDASLLRELLPRATMIKLNAAEAAEIERMLGGTIGSLEKFCRTCSARFGYDGVCVTNGEDGCALLLNDEFLLAQGYTVEAKDTVGAGDAFAAALVHGMGSGWPLSRIADFANRVGALVASRAGGVPSWSVAEAEALRPGANPHSDSQSQHRETA